MLTNDTDADIPNDTLTATQLFGAGNEPQHGTLTLDSDGTFEYVHDNSENLSDSFLYLVSDGLNTSVGQVDITVLPTNDNAPQVPDSSIMVDEGGLYASVSSAVTLIDGLSDVDGDIADFTVIVTSQPINGALSLTGNHGYEYQNNGTETTSDTFEYVVCLLYTSDAADE